MALLTPGQSLQGAVSMARLLGIGIYRSDGSRITKGRESGERDVFLFEDEVRALAEMGIETDEGDFVTFRAFHASLAAMGLSLSAEELAQRYQAAYEANPDEPIVRLIQSVGGVDVDAEMTKLLAWLLFLDGFVPPHVGPTASLTTVSAPAIAAEAGAAGKGWGVAAPHIGVIALLLIGDPADVPLVIFHLMMVARLAMLTVDTSEPLVHEGHGGTGQPVTFRSRLDMPFLVWSSPTFTGNYLVPTNPSFYGLPVEWALEDTLLRHGTTTPAGPGIDTTTTTTDDVGITTLTFTPREEEANGEGDVARAETTIEVEMSTNEVMEQMYGAPRNSLIGFIGGHVVQAEMPLQIEWHAKDVVTLHGTFSGHYSDSLATADLTIEVEVRWNAGPDDIHDRNAFTLTSGSFTFSETISGVCGGSRSVDGTLTSFVNEQSLLYADPRERDNVHVSVIDQRMETGGVQFAVSGYFDVPNADPEGCGDLDRSGVGTCGLVFLATAIGELQREATCTGPSGDWTGRLQP